jgi:protein-L-isoaspartate(D-aspartate) O-methyltransferase
MFVPMTGIAEDTRKVRRDPAHPQLVNGGFEQTTDDRPDVWFYVRQATLERRGAPEGKFYLTFANSDPGRDAQALQAFGVDGARVKTLHVALWLKAENALPGARPWERPSLDIHFFDSENRPAGEQHMGPWAGTFDWTRVSTDLRVPKQSHMAVLRVGLNGATGRLSVDDIQLTSRP